MHEKVEAIFPEDLKDLIQKSREGTYTLLDVRQPVEFEEGHLPGARLIPLPELADSLGTLDPRKPTVVYCAVGGRSLMAAQLLSNQGFQKVLQLQGGIQAWEDPAAVGPVEFPLKFIRGDESPREAIQLALLMERGLKTFHSTATENTDDPSLKQLLNSLVKAEESHERTLVDLLEQVDPGQDDAEQWFGTPDDTLLMEGGIDMEVFMQENEQYLQTVSGYLEVAMMIETQALDLYLRMAAASSNEETQKVLYRIGEEEKIHLGMLGRLLDENAGTPFRVP